MVYRFLNITHFKLLSHLPYDVTLRNLTKTSKWHWEITLTINIFDRTLQSKSLTYTKNNVGPKIDPRGTPEWCWWYSKERKNNLMVSGLDYISILSFSDPTNIVQIVRRLMHYRLLDTTCGTAPKGITLNGHIKKCAFASSFYVSDPKPQIWFMGLIKLILVFFFYNIIRLWISLILTRNYSPCVP